jgi:hypothetical protein
MVDGYEECVVEDRLCWRTSLNNEWVPFAATELTTMILDYRYMLERDQRSLEVLKKEIGVLIT